MSNKSRITEIRITRSQPAAVSFVLWISGFFRNSSFGFRHCTGYVGGDGYGSASTNESQRILGFPTQQGAHLDSTTRNFLPLPARNEWGEGRPVLRSSSATEGG